MKHTLQVLTYNNYYNRIIKVEDDLESYAKYVVFSIEGVNFSENDGIDTEHILGGATEYDGKGDYLLSIDENNNFKRWFILEAQRTRAGQWKLSLRRDIVADYKENAINAPAFIEKATVDANDVAIFNSENMSFNQIKTSQTFIKDASQTAWLVAYLEKDTGFEGSFSTDKSNILDVDGIENWEHYKYVEGDLRLLLSSSKFNFSYLVRRVNLLESFSYFLNGTYSGRNNYGEYYNKLDRVYVQYDSLHNYENIFEGTDILQEILGKNNIVDSIPSMNYEYIRDNLTGKLYSISIKSQGEETIKNYVVDGGDYANLYLTLRSRINAWALSQGITFTYPSNEGSTTDNRTFELIISAQNYRIVLEEVNDTEQKKYKISELHIPTNDSVFDIIAIPYGKCQVISSGNIGINLITVDKETVISWVTDIAKRGGAKVYDIQLLPYAPPLYGAYTFYRQITEEVGYPLIYISDINYLEQNYVFLKNYEDVVIGVGLYVTNSMFSKKIPFNFAIPQNEWKIENECSVWRLNSPNWASIFEFNVVKNGGQITEFSIDCHYKPYTPYINVAPTWSGLYGQAFEKEARGLILSGDFSIPRLDSAWTQYQLNNKTYEMAFNRQIQSIELKNRQQDVKDVINAVAGTVQGGVTGAAGGAMAGGAYGAIAGAVVGTAASAIGGVADVQMNRELRADQLDLTRDLYGYNLQTIKARPDTLTNVSAFNADNSIFPTLEYYTCTETEKQALRDKMKYNGMTVMRIGRIADFLLPEPQYIKARIIRLEGMDEDFHLVNELVNEIYKGVFI